MEITTGKVYIVQCRYVQLESQLPSNRVYLYNPNPEELSSVLYSNPLCIPTAYIIKTSPDQLPRGLKVHSSNYCLVLDIQKEWKKAPSNCILIKDTATSDESNTPSSNIDYYLYTLGDNQLGDVTLNSQDYHIIKNTDILIGSCTKWFSANLLPYLYRLVSVSDSLEQLKYNLRFIKAWVWLTNSLYKEKYRGVTDYKLKDGKVIKLFMPSEKARIIWNELIEENTWLRI